MTRASNTEVIPARARAPHCSRNKRTMPVITMMTGATAWHYFAPDDDDDDDDDPSSSSGLGSLATPAAVVAAARARRRKKPGSDAPHHARQPVVLILHANGFGAATYAPLARSLRASLAGTALASAPILAPDFPGQGDSWRAFAAALGRPLSAPRFAAWLLAALAAQGLLADSPPPASPSAPAIATATTTAAAADPELFVFGHSGGAATALVAEALGPGGGTFAAIFAYEPVEAPPAVREAQGRALLLGPAGNKGEPLARMARRRRPAFESREAARRTLGAKPPFSSLCAEALDLYVRTQMVVVAAAAVGGSDGGASGGAVRLKCAPEVEAEYFQAFSRPPHAWRPERVRCPVALACGGAAGLGLGEGGGRGGGGGASGGGEGPHDALAAWAPLTARALPRGEMTPPFARLGHLGPLEDPGAVGAAAGAFFARVAAAAAAAAAGGCGRAAAAARSRL